MYIIMDEKQTVTIVFVVYITLCGFIAIGACLYAIPLCFIQRFHKPVHLLSLNVCIAAFICSTSWITFYTMEKYYSSILWTSKTCLPVIYLENMVICQLIYALCSVSLNRLFTIVYQDKPLFRSKRWAAICITIQWISGILTPLPILLSNADHCLISGLELNHRIYLIIIAIVLPSMSSVVADSIIFIYARRSTGYVQRLSGDSTQAPTIRPRDARVLKHMIIMFAVFFCSWGPIYTVMAINWRGTAVSPILVQIISTVPTLATLIDIIDLFIYNHEFRRHFSNRWQMDHSNRRLS